MTFANDTVALIRQGSILPLKFPYATDGSSIMTLEDVRLNNPYLVEAVLDENQEASGYLYVDDGKRIGPHIVGTSDLEARNS